MKILFFIHTLSGGGIERSTLRLGGQFLALGHRVIIVAFSSRPDVLKNFSERFEVFFIKSEGIFSRLFEFNKIIRNINPDLVISAAAGPNMISCIANGILSHKRLVIISQRGRDDLLYKEFSSLQFKLLQKLCWLSYRKADAIVAVSSGVARELMQIPGLQQDRIHVIYNPVWTPELEAQPLDKPPGPWLGQANIPVIVSVGRLAKEKDYETLIRAFAALRRRRHVRLIILGEGEYRPTLEHLSQELNLGNDLIMPGFVEHPMSYVAHADVFALSSIHEGFGNVLVEAMACGTPVVSTDCPSGPREILDAGRYGLLVPVADPEALADAIEQQIDEPIVSPEVLRARAREFSVEASASAYLAITRELIARTGEQKWNSDK